jgi:arylsulfatase A-like enzyme
MRPGRVTTRLLGRLCAAVLALTLAGCGGSGGNNRNVLLIVIDTLRADHLGIYGYGRPTSPEIDAWAAKGAVFDRAFATSPWTLPSFGSIYTGQIPSRHTAGLVGPSQDGQRGFVRLDPSVRTIAEILSEHGYATAAIVNNPFLHPNFEISRGFEVYDYVPGDNAEIRRANVIVDRTLAWLDQREGGPFLLLSHFFDPHINYDPPIAVPISAIRGIRSGELSLDERDREVVTAAYDEEVFFVDVQVGRLLDGIRSRGLLDDTVIVLVSDHGEEFWDHGGFEHGHTMFQELLHVPMIVWGPDVRPPRIGEPVSIADVLPTVLEALELPAEEGISGRSLWGSLTEGDPIPERGLVAEGNLYGPERKALIRWPHKVVLNIVTRERKLFDLEADPEEKEDRAKEQVALLNSLLSELQAELRSATRERVQSQAAELDAATRDQLRALGYLE